jgi:formate hydrogenlyase subunit 5
MTTSAATNLNAFERISCALNERFGQDVVQVIPPTGVNAEFDILQPAVLPNVCSFLFSEAECSFGGIIVEEREDWNIRYVFLAPDSIWLHCLLRLPLSTTIVPSISTQIHPADWYEREAEDLFGLDFEEHPRLGDFVLHDQVWHEGVAPMRKQFNATAVEIEKRPKRDWHPMLVVQEPGAFAMPVGPVYEGGIGESVHFLLETVGEDVIRAVPRLFYNYRGIEKIAEGQTVSDVLLLSERFAATSAFAHSLAYCQAIENAAGVELPERARLLRVALSEIERLRHHAGSIAGICRSTALSVSEAHAAIIEEQLLRASCVFTGSRYLFGLNIPGGLRRDFEASECEAFLRAVESASKQLNRLEEQLRFSSSFLDRLEDVGIVTPDKARELDLVGPVGRASGNCRDLRRLHPYSGYDGFRFEVACEKEGDGYARLRVLFEETRQSARLISQALAALKPGEVHNPLPETPRGTAALGWVEAPTGAALHWVRLDHSGRVERYRVLSPSFRNWLGLHIAVEDFAFQDFPIILATLALSAAECDR